MIELTEFNTRHSGLFGEQFLLDISCTYLSLQSLCLTCPFSRILCYGIISYIALEVNFNAVCYITYNI